VIGNSMSYPGEALDVTGFDEGFYDWNAGRSASFFPCAGVANKAHVE